MRKQLTIMGTVWDFWPVLKVYDKNFESKYISFYEPWLKDEVGKEKIIKFSEKKKSIFLWPFKIIGRTIRIFSVIRRFEPDLVISHHDATTISILPTLFITKYILRKRNRFIAYVHAGIESYNSKTLFSAISNLIIRLLYPSLDMVITVSEGNKKALEERFALKNVKVIYNPVDLTKIEELSHEKNLDERFKSRGGRTFLTIGRLTEQKGQWYLIRAFKEVTDRYPDAILYVIGEGELKKELENFIIKLGLKENVILLGRKGNVYSYLKGSDFFVLTSLWESFGQVLVEALALNKPVIATDCKFGPREVLSPSLEIKEKIKYPFYGEYGILTEPFKREIIFKSKAELPLNKQEKALSELLVACINKSKIRERYSVGLQRAREFDIGMMEEKIADLL